MQIAVELGMTYATVQHFCFRHRIKHAEGRGYRTYMRDPTPAEIMDAARRIRETWSDEEWVRR